MISQKPVKKGFFAKYWGLLLGLVALIGVIVVAAGVLVYLFVLRGEGKVTALELSAETIVYGKPLQALVTVQNDRVLECDYHVALLVDGVEAKTQDIKLESKVPQKLTMDISGLKPGMHKIAVAKTEKEFKVLKPAEFRVSDLAIAQELILAGDEITVTASVTNDGEVPGDYVAKFTYDGATGEEIKVTVAPGAAEKLESKITVKNKGKHTVGIGELKQSFDALMPAKIEITAFKLAKVYVKPGESVSAKVTLANSGDVEGKFKLELLVNGEVDQSAEVTVAGKDTVVHTFTFSPPKAGKYAIKVGDFTATLSAVTIARPANGTVLIKTVAVSNSTGYVRIFNTSSDKDAMMVLTTNANTDVAVLAVFVRANQNVVRLYVKQGYYQCYYTIGGSFDTSSKRFTYQPQYYLLTKFTPLNLYDYWYTLVLNADSAWSSIKEEDFPD